MKPTGDSLPGIGTRVRIEGVVVKCEVYGMSVRLPDGTIQSFSYLAVSAPDPESPRELRDELLHAERDEMSSGEVWDEAGMIAAEQRIDYLKAQLGEPSSDIHQNHLRSD
jgi:hypothetical protein